MSHRLMMPARAAMALCALLVASCACDPPSDAYEAFAAGEACALAEDPCAALDTDGPCDTCARSSCCEPARRCARGADGACDELVTCTRTHCITCAPYPGGVQ